MSIPVMDQPSRTLMGMPGKQAAPAEGYVAGEAAGGVVSANLRVLRAADGERRCLVMVKVGSASVCLPIDEARQAVSDAHDLPRQIEAAIAIADQVAQHRHVTERSVPNGSMSVEEPAGDGDDGVISGRLHSSAARKAAKMSFPRRLCRGLLSRG